MKHDNPIPRRARWMKVLATYFFEIEHRSEKKMGHTDYLSRINQSNTKYPWKVDLEETSYQAVCRETREKTGLHTAQVYLITDKGFNYNLYTMNIGERIS